MPTPMKLLHIVIVEKGLQQPSIILMTAEHAILKYPFSTLTKRKQVTTNSTGGNTRRGRQCCGSANSFIAAIRKCFYSKPLFNGKRRSVLSRFYRRNNKIMLSRKSYCHFHSQHSYFIAISSYFKTMFSYKMFQNFILASKL